MKQQTNRLAGETSPYLLQHADNPVAWYPWSQEALDAAVREDKPILLSIGYSACHWCHVMAHESFEDEATAAVMNQHFINIKVDREERPDLDKIYQLAHQMIAQRGGGWPLTMFLTPGDQMPFFGGTYFPPESRHGLPGFRDLLLRVSDYFRENRDGIASQAGNVRDAFASIWEAPGGPESVLGPKPLQSARDALGEHFDPRHGGFGQAPKFPHPTSIERLLRHWRASATGADPDVQALFMATMTLRQMAEGGLYDQLGGGFFRYSVDDFWMIPHFEKMGYDNAQLLPLYARAWAATDDPLFQRVSEETADWVMRELQAPDGGYYSTLDADSEGAEGKFYVWEASQVEALLEPEEFAVLAPVYGLDRPANFEGRWHLHTHRRVPEVASELGLPEEDAWKRLESGRRKLLARRDTRVRPGRDEKILTAWNGLMIAGMAVAARILGREDFGESAARAADFVRAHLWRDGRLLATTKDGRGRYAAYLDDYAFLLEGCLELLQTRWDASVLDFATDLAEVLLVHFEDPKAGGFFFTADDHEALIERPRPLADEATPSGNGVAARALNRLGHLLAEPRYLDSAERALKSAWPALEKASWAHCTLADALEEVLAPPEIVLVRGEGRALDEWRRAASLVYAPRRLVFAIPAAEPGLPAAIAAKDPGEGLRGWICRGSTCLPPFDRLADLLAELRETPAAG